MVSGCSLMLAPIEVTAKAATGMTTANAIATTTPEVIVTRRYRPKERTALPFRLPARRALQGYQVPRAVTPLAYGDLVLYCSYQIPRINFQGTVGNARRDADAVA